MGWCIDCHRGEMPLSEEERTAVTQRSSYVREIAALAAAGNDTRALTATWPNQIASIDCTVCHY